LVFRLLGEMISGKISLHVTLESTPAMGRNQRHALIKGSL
jgi:hypothetical protein